MNDQSPDQDKDVQTAIIGAGRMGQGLALALAKRGRKAALFKRDWKPSAIRSASLIIVAVPDDAIRSVASELAARGAVTAEHTVLHLSGLLDRGALAPLAASGAALGSFHPLQSISDPARAHQELTGAYAAIEGDPRAIATAEALAEALGMTAVPIAAESKPAYHAAAAIVSNYTTTLLDIAERIARDAGIPPSVATRLYLPLLHGTVTNLTASEPAAALTGPVRRGDVQTVRAHLNALKPPDRDLYRQLALATLTLALRAGLDPVKATQLRELLTTAT
jgi:predicted short-subunit dehydrogenase-like oxidoreductase (DUF2520 family)